LDHFLWIRIMGTGAPYTTGFYACTLVFLAATLWLKVVKRKHGEQMAAKAGPEVRRAARQ